jgi:hypothetical protein
LDRNRTPYAEGGIVFGPQRGDRALQLELPAVPIAGAVPVVRHTVIGDWKFFLDNEDLLNLWARRFGESAVHALADELRRLPWREGRG